MKNLWTLFVMGLFCAAAASFVINETRASDTKDARVNKIDDDSISGEKAAVPSVKDMETALTKKEAEIKERERRVKESEARLAVEEARIKDRVDELQKMLDQLDQKQQANHKTSAATLARLVKTFQTMAPKKPPAVIASMNDDLAVELFMAMKEKSVAGVLDVMDPARATALSSLVAKRRPAGAKATEEEGQPPPSAEGPR